MHKNVIIVISLTSLLLGSYLIQKREIKVSNESTPNIVNIVNLDKNGFYPTEIKIRRGDSVKFTTTAGKYFWPASNIHPTHEIYPAFDPKRPIRPDESWTFTFTKVGRWRYHDHLSPNFEGTIRVSDNPLETNKVSSLEDCKKADNDKKQQCWDNLMEQTLAKRGLEEAFVLFEKLYETEPDVPKSCHGWGHTLGKAAFKLYNKNQKFTFSPKTSYCGYGFYHGFIESLLQSGTNIKKTKDFCHKAKKQLAGKANGVYENCLHGIGHGAVEVDDPKIWGDFQAMLMPGLKTCESILSSPKELELCYTGAFNAMELNAFYGDYKLKYDPKHPFSLCKNQQRKYQSACYFEFAGTLSSATNHDFAKAASFILEIPDPLIAQTTVRKTAADFLDIDIVNKDFSKNISYCHSLPDYLRIDCINGIEIGFIAHGNPETGFKQAINFCTDRLLAQDEKEFCLKSLMGNIKFNYSTEKFRQVCETYKDLKKYCES